MSPRFLLLLPWFAVACSEPSDETTGGVCPAATGAADPVEEALSVGLDDGSGFEPMTEGQTVPIVRGFQGGYMITPVVRADQALFGTDGACVHLAVTAEVSAELSNGVAYDFGHVKLTDAYWVTDTIPLFLTYDSLALEGATCTVTATWRDDDREASTSLAVVLSSGS